MFYLIGSEKSALGISCLVDLIRISKTSNRDTNLSKRNVNIGITQAPNFEISNCLTNIFDMEISSLLLNYNSPIC